MNVLNLIINGLLSIYGMPALWECGGAMVLNLIINGLLSIYE